MAISTIGILKDNIGLYNIHNYIKKNIDINAIIETQNNNSHYINFNYKEENRSMHLFMNCYDYKCDTKYDGLVNVMVLGYYGYSCEIIEKLVKHFGGWFMENDSYNDIEFYEFYR